MNTMQNAAIPPVESSEHKIGSAASVWSGAPTSATVNGVLVALFAVGDTIVAFNGRCPHASGPLHKGKLKGTTLSCPWHGWTFDVISGACEEDPSLVLERFAVRVDGDDVLVTL
jgi:nitrite reductase (NADH) small subunit